MQVTERSLEIVQQIQQKAASGEKQQQYPLTYFSGPGEMGAVVAMLCQYGNLEIEAGGAGLKVKFTL